MKLLAGWALKRGKESAELGMILINVKTRQPVREGMIQVRGSGDQAWSAALNYLLANRILAHGTEELAPISAPGRIAFAHNR